MNNHITVVSRARFKQMVESGQIPEGTAIISIHEPKNKIIVGGYALPWPKILEDSDTVLNLWFNDSEEYNPHTETVLFDEDMADKVVEFVERNKDAKQWLLHCTAGISRSGAVGGFVADYLGVSYLDYKKANPKICPNALVSKLLTQRLF
jgi:predicted protein tyrosine phosphatase